MVRSVALVIAMLACRHVALGRLSKEEVENLRQKAAWTIAIPAGENDPYHYLSWNGSKAIDQAIKEKEYSVLEAAISSPKSYGYDYALFDLMNVPIEERKRLAMMALLTPRIWPDPVEADRFQEGSMHQHWHIVQVRLTYALSTAFGMELNYPNFWSAEERLALAKRIREQVTASTPPDELPEWAKTPLPTAAALAAGSQPLPKSPTISEPKPKDAESSIRSPLRWLIVTAGVLLGGAWILRRGIQKRT